MSNLHIPEEVANQIVHEYKLKLIDELRGHIERLDTKLEEVGTPIFGARKALMDVITLLEERNWYKSYNIASLPLLNSERES